MKHSFSLAQTTQALGSLSKLNYKCKCEKPRSTEYRKCHTVHSVTTDKDALGFTVDVAKKHSGYFHVKIHENRYEGVWKRECFNHLRSILARDWHTMCFDLLGHLF